MKNNRPISSPLFCLFCFLLITLGAGGVYGNDKYKQYVNTLRGAIRNHWYPGGIDLKGKKTSAQVLIRMNPQGKLESYEWKQRSGSSAYDDACLVAIQKAFPLPVPPVNAPLRLFYEGVIIGCRDQAIDITFPTRELCTAAEEKLANPAATYVLLSSIKDKAYASELNALIGKKYWFSTMAGNRVVDAAFGGTKVLKGMVGVTVLNTGEVESREVICSSPVKVFNEELDRIVKRIKKLPPPPSTLLGQDQKLRVMWHMTLYLKS